MATVVYFLLVTSPLWIAYIVLAERDSPRKVVMLWVAIATIAGSWLYVVDRTHGAMFGMLRVFQNVPPIVALSIAGLSLLTQSRARNRPMEAEDESQRD